MRRFLMRRTQSRTAMRTGVSAVLATVVLPMAALVSTAQSPPPGAPLEKMPLSVAFISSSVPHMNRNDAEAAFKVFTQTAGRKLGYDMKVQTETFSKPAEFDAACANTSFHIVILDAWDFLVLRTAGQLEPTFTPLEEGMLAEPYLLLTKRGGGLDTLASLRGKEAVILDSITANLSRPWMDTLLLEGGLGTTASFFGHVQSVGKPSAAILPVFFGAKSACVTDRSGFDIMKELNPQVGHALQVVAASEPFTDSLICLGKSGWVKPKHKEDIKQSLAELHIEPTGQQILTLFKTDKLIPFQEEHLVTVRALRAKHDRLSKGGRP